MKKATGLRPQQEAALDVRLTRTADPSSFEAMHA